MINLAKILGRAKNVAMQYSPKSAIPYVATVDAGTIELVRSVGAKVVSSADLVQKFEACWTAQQLESHRKAGAVVDRVVREAFQYAARCVRDKKPLTEYDLKSWILKEFEAAGVGAAAVEVRGRRDRDARRGLLAPDRGGLVRSRCGRRGGGDDEHRHRQRGEEQGRSHAKLSNRIT